MYFSCAELFYSFIQAHLLIIFTYLSNILNAGLLVVMVYFYSLVFVLKWGILVLIPPLLIFSCLQAVEDVNVTFEDQQKINKFARNTSRMTELKSEIEAKKVSTMCCEYIFKSQILIIITAFWNNDILFRPDTHHTIMSLLNRFILDHVFAFNYQFIWYAYQGISEVLFSWGL